MKNSKSFLKNMSEHPGVYIMRGVKQNVLYIGKAKHLKKRLNQHFQTKTVSERMQRMLRLVTDVEVMITETEEAALLLENEQIKQHQPPYNVLLRDDKSYPYIYLSKDKHPRMAFYRGVKHNKQGNYFGPYPSASLVRESIALLQKTFRIRSCTNSVYQNRSRPCLEYQIKRCSAPCVNKISDEIYQNDVDMAKLFLQGNNQKVLTILAQSMQDASDNLLFEQAGRYRDQLVSLRKMQEKHHSGLSTDTDIIYLLNQQQTYCVQLLFMRQGRQVGQASFFPKNTKNVADDEVLSAFISQYYIRQRAPSTCVVNVVPQDKKLLENTFKTKLITQPRQDKKQLLNIAKLNAEESIRQYLKRNRYEHKQLMRLKSIFALKRAHHIECFDISHTGGESAVASCVVFAQGREDKKRYRLFNINNITLGDDYAAIHQAVLRRYKRLQQNVEKMPDIIFIDGGLGQLTKALEALDELAIRTLVIAVTKGEKRKAGLETLISIDQTTGQTQKIKLPSDDLALLLINRIRDEAHRFAITSHRKKRSKKRHTSILSGIEGIGVNKTRALLNYFGGIQEVEKATLEQLCKVPGINALLAKRVIAQRGKQV